MKCYWLDGLFECHIFYFRCISYTIFHNDACWGNTTIYDGICLGPENEAECCKGLEQCTSCIFWCWYWVYAGVFCNVFVLHCHHNLVCLLFLCVIYIRTSLETRELSRLHWLCCYKEKPFNLVCKKPVNMVDW